MTLQKYIEQAYVGRVLTGCEYGMNQPGCQSVTVPQRVAKAEVGTTDGDRDPCVWLTLENGERAYFYANEEIYFESVSVGPSLYEAADLLDVGSRLRWGTVLGKIIARDGGMLSFCTPHGTLVKAGLVWMAKDTHPLTESEDAQLTQWEADAAEKGVLYSPH